MLAAPAGGGGQHVPILKGTLRSLRYAERFIETVASEGDFPGVDVAALEVLSTPLGELRALADEPVGRGRSWGKFLRAHGAGALPAHVKPAGADGSSAASAAAAPKGPGRTKQLQRKRPYNVAACEDESPIALLECCATRAELPALRARAPTLEVHAAADVVFAAQARARWAQMSAAERLLATEAHDNDPRLHMDLDSFAYDVGPEPLKPNFFEVVDLKASPLVILPGDVRLTVRWEEPESGRGLGRGSALLLRRVLPAAPPEVAVPTMPPTHYATWQDYRAKDYNMSY